ncbi:MAG TPA: cache domain-containing protein, partial [Candidatus Cloacimonadota bacterium]|nr:cache domain-containing protein [Candidatus Cloacimonadota bacterium]
MQHLAHEKVHQVEGRLIKIRTLAKLSLDTMQDFSLSTDAINEYLLNLISDNSEVTSVCIGYEGAKAPESIVHFSVRRRNFSRHLNYADFQYQDWYQIPAITGKSSWIEPWFDADGKGKWIVSYVIPFYTQGVLSGVMRFDTELSYLQDIVSNFAMTRNIYSFLVSSTGTIITHKDPSLVMNHTLFSLAEEYQDENLAKLGKGMLRADVGYMRLTSDSPFGDAWIYYNPLPINKWSLGVVIPYAELMEKTNLILVIQTLSSILLFLAIAIIVFTRTQSVVKPLRALTIAADKIGAGDFDTELPDHDKAYEIAKLTQSFKAMQKSINEYIQNLTITTQEKEQIRGDVIYASEIQNNLIPKNTTHPFGLEELRVYGILEPAGDIGGDLYDYFMIDE